MVWKQPDTGTGERTLDGDMPRLVPVKAYSLTIALVLAAGVFIVDLFVPLGWVVWLPYVALLLTSLWLPQKRAVLILAAVCSVFMIVGFLFDIFFEASGIPRELGIFNRSLGLLMLWVVAVLIEMRQQLEQERENLIAKLEDALASIKTLRGFLPICASCKKVRDDKGYWNRIETYLSEHSLAEFTHSLCPECSEDLMEELHHGPPAYPEKS